MADMTRSCVARLWAAVEACSRASIPLHYHLSRARYGQFGFKIHTEGTGVMNNLIYGANIYRVTYSSQEIDIGLANGDTIAANGAARYQGLNYFLDDDPARNLHVFVNGNFEAARYTSYVVNNSGGSFNGSARSLRPRIHVQRRRHLQFQSGPRRFDYPGWRFPVCRHTDHL